MRVRSLLVAVTIVAAAGSACGDGGGDLEAFCATARRFAADNPAAVFDRYDPADPASAALLLRDAGARLSAWADEAPGEVDDEVQVIADAAVALAGEFERPEAAASDDLQARLAAVEGASADVLEFTRTECDVDLDPSAVPSTTSTTAPAG